MAISEQPITAHSGWLQERVETKPKPDTAAATVGIGGNRRNLDTSQVVVESEVAGGEEAHGFSFRFRFVSGDFGKTKVGIVAVQRTVREVPHDLGCHLRVIGIEQGKRLSGDVVLQ